MPFVLRAQFELLLVTSCLFTLHGITNEYIRDKAYSARCQDGPDGTP